MCGIAGLVRYDRPGQENLPHVRAILRALRHRGPDDEGVAALSHAAIGNVRLSFLDRKQGAQPMRDRSDRWWITYNGEVYNHQALRDELAEGWDFQSQCDTEVVLAACVQWGVAALGRLNGMFSFFLWDEATQTGFAARDRLGVKPFAYSISADGLAFASEAKALLSTLSARPRAHFDGVLEYLVAPYFSGVEHAMYDGIRYLPPGHWLRMDRDGLDIQPWWDWSYSDAFDMDPDILAPELGRRISESVRQTLQGDHPCAAFLSGGLDSTLIAAIAAPLCDQPMTAYTVQFAGQESFDYPHSRIVRSDDTPHARAAASALGLDHRMVSVRREELSSDLASLSAINDALPAWEQELAQHHLARAASREHRAVLVGDAADETHYGYAFLLDPEATRAPSRIMERFGAAPLSRELRGTCVRALDQQYRALAESAGYRWETPLDQLLATAYLIVKRWLPRLLHNGDIHTMAFSVEARVPFADTSLLGLAERVHPHLAVNGAEEKRLLRAAARGLVPEAQRTRTKSALPKDQQTSAVYQTEAQRAVRESGRFLSAWLDLAGVESLTNAERSLTENERSLLFRVIALHHWSKTYNVSAP